MKKRWLQYRTQPLGVESALILCYRRVSSCTKKTQVNGNNSYWLRQSQRPNWKSVCWKQMYVFVWSWEAGHHPFDPHTLHGSALPSTCAGTLQQYLTLSCLSCFGLPYHLISWITSEKGHCVQHFGRYRKVPHTCFHCSVRGGHTSYIYIIETVLWTC